METRCKDCKCIIIPFITGRRKIGNDIYCSSCYYVRLGKVVEEHPIGGPLIIPGCVHDAIVINNNPVLFYIREEENGYLSNFERSEQEIDGIRYRTNEHYYQSKKAKDPDMERWIANAPNAYAAMKAGRALRPEEMTENWGNKKYDVMLIGLRAKFTQNKELADMLLSTGDRKIHETNSEDRVWGVNGLDMLGKLLTRVRNELRTGRCNNKE